MILLAAIITSALTIKSSIKKEQEWAFIRSEDCMGNPIIKKNGKWHYLG